MEEIYESHPMMLMIKYKRTDLLGHPLCRALVRYKWTTVIVPFKFHITHSNNILLQFGQIVFYFNVIYYCVFIGLFTGFMLNSTKPHDPLELSNMSNNPKYTFLRTTRKIFVNIFYPQHHHTRPDIERDHQPHDLRGVRMGVE